MNIEKLNDFLSTVELPILTEETDTPRQLVLEKNGEVIASYDPVYSFETSEGGTLTIKGWLNRNYVHALNTFDTVKIYKYGKDLAYQAQEVLQEFNHPNT